MWLWPLAHGCICIYLTVSSKWELLPQGFVGFLWQETGQSPGLAGASIQSHLSLQGSLSSWVLNGKWLVQADLLSLQRAPFSSYLSSLALCCFMSPGCGRTGLEQEGEFSLQWACKSCLCCWDGWRHSRGLQEGCTGPFPRLGNARAIWPLQLLAACMTVWLMFLDGVNSLQLCVVSLKELKGSWSVFQSGIVLPLTISTTC